MNETSNDDSINSRNDRPTNTINRELNTSNLSFHLNGTSALNISPMNRTVGERRRPSAANTNVFQNPTPSPDEIIIKGRGRRSLPVKWSPIPIESPQKTPCSLLSRRSPKKGLIALRSSPRKRLQLNNPSPTDLLHSRKLLLSSSPLASRNNDCSAVFQPHLSFETVVDKLNKKDLVFVLKGILEKHPEIKDEVIQEIPNHETWVVVQQLIDMQNSICELLFCSDKKSSGSLSKVTANFSSMMKIIEDHCQELSMTKQWESLMEFVLTSWPFVSKTPMSESRIQLKYLRNPHYKILAQYSFEALNNLNFQEAEIDVELLCYRYQQLSKDHDAILTSQGFLTNLKKET